MTDVFGELRFLYVGTHDTTRAVAAYLDAFGGRLRWRFQHFGADVAAIELGEGDGPLVLLADHRPDGSVLPIWAVDDLAEAQRRAEEAGARTIGPVGTPEGDAVVVHLADGGELALLEVVRPGAMDGAYADPANPRRVAD